jgi:hypothetical protein
MKFLVAVLAALPLVSQAQTLYVQYEGVVVPSTGTLREGYRIGDKVSGTLFIDTLLAPRTNVQPDNGFAYYGAPSPYPVDFVTGWTTSGNSVGDFVYIDEGRGPNTGRNFYQVADVDANRSAWVWAVSSEIKSLDLVQTFDVKEDDEGSFMQGVLTWGRRSIEEVVLRLTRMSVTPGQCRP